MYNFIFFQRRTKVIVSSLIFLCIFVGDSIADFSTNRLAFYQYLIYFISIAVVILFKIFHFTTQYF